MPDTAPVIFRWRFGSRAVTVTADTQTAIARALAMRGEARGEDVARAAMAEMQWLECFKEELGNDNIASTQL